jgi:hypothetical protein
LYIFFVLIKAEKAEAEAASLRLKVQRLEEQLASVRDDPMGGPAAIKNLMDQMFSVLLQHYKARQAVRNQDSSVSSDDTPVSMKGKGGDSIVYIDATMVDIGCPQVDCQVPTPLCFPAVKHGFILE